jgi:hypothetical protein
MQILNSFRNWLIVFLGGKPQDAGAADKADEAQEVAYRESSTSVVFDGSLFERSRTQWHFGDWAALAGLQRETIQNHPQRAKLALLAAAGRLQTGADAEAREYITLAKDWGCSQTLISRVLISGVHNSLGRAASVMGDHARALEHYGASVQSATPGNDARLLAQARFDEQTSQLGVALTNQLSTSLVATLIK